MEGARGAPRGPERSGPCTPSRDGYLLEDDRRLLGQCQVDRYRASGPGGQKRNKTSSAVRLRHGPTGVVVVARESRSQEENRARAIRRLRMAIALKVRERVELVGYEPPRWLGSGGGSWVEVSRRDRRYPLVVAAVLDVVAAAGGRVGLAARMLGVATGRLTRFLRRDGKLWGQVNEIRRQGGCRPLR